MPHAARPVARGSCANAGGQAVPARAARAAARGSSGARCTPGAAAAQILRGAGRGSGAPVARAARQARRHGRLRRERIVLARHARRLCSGASDAKVARGARLRAKLPLDAVVLNGAVGAEGDAAKATPEARHARRHAVRARGHRPWQRAGPRRAHPPREGVGEVHNGPPRGGEQEAVNGSGLGEAHGRAHACCGGASAVDAGNVVSALRVKVHQGSNDPIAGAKGHAGARPHARAVQRARWVGAQGVGAGRLQAIVLQAHGHGVAGRGGARHEQRARSAWRWRVVGRPRAIGGRLLPGLAGVCRGGLLVRALRGEAQRRGRARRQRQGVPRVGSARELHRRGWLRSVCGSARCLASRGLWRRQLGPGAQQRQRRAGALLGAR